ncbi:MAG: phosphatase PAP2 family protein [Pseudomonadota bacterium]
MAWLKNRGLVLVLALIVGSIAISDRSASGVGDTLQVVLPLTGLGCAIATGQGVRYTGRYLVVSLALQSSKRGLGEAEINARPNGGYHGMPSGHTTAASFGAAGIAQHCVAGNAPAQVMAGMAAGLVGGTRIEVGAHNVWQVLAGAILGWGGQVVAFAAFDAWFRRVWFGAGRGILRAARWLRDGVSRLG